MELTPGIGDRADVLLGRMHEARNERSGAFAQPCVEAGKLVFRHAIDIGDGHQSGAFAGEGFDVLVSETVDETDMDVTQTHFRSDGLERRHHGIAALGIR